MLLVIEKWSLFYSNSLFQLKNSYNLTKNIHKHKCIMHQLLDIKVDVCFYEMHLGKCCWFELFIYKDNLRASYQMKLQSKSFSNITLGMSRDFKKIALYNNIEVFLPFSLCDLFFRINVANMWFEGKLSIKWYSKIITFSNVYQNLGAYLDSIRVQYFRLA